LYNIWYHHPQQVAFQCTGAPDGRLLRMRIPDAVQYTFDLQMMSI
jgi:hypothetical protein